MPGRITTYDPVVTRSDEDVFYLVQGYDGIDPLTGTSLKDTRGGMKTDVVLTVKNTLIQAPFDTSASLSAFNVTNLSDGVLANVIEPTNNGLYVLQKTATDTVIDGVIITANGGGRWYKVTPHVMPRGSQTVIINGASPAVTNLINPLSKEILIDTLVASKSVALPDVTEFSGPEIGFQFYIYNIGTESIDISGNDLGAIVTIPAENVFLFTLKAKSNSITAGWSVIQFGTISTQNASNVAISGGTVTGLSDLSSTTATISGGSITGLTSFSADTATIGGGTLTNLTSVQAGAGTFTTSLSANNVIMDACQLTNVTVFTATDVNITGGQITGIGDFNTGRCEFAYGIGGGGAEDTACSLTLNGVFGLRWPLLNNTQWSGLTKNLGFSCFATDYDTVLIKDSVGEKLVCRSHIVTQSTSLDFAGAFVANGVLVYWSKSGHTVTLHFPDILASSGATVAASQLTSTALPIFLRPIYRCDFPARINDNSATPSIDEGLVRVRTDGIIEIYRNEAGAVFTAATLGVGAFTGLQGRPFTYISSSLALS